MDNPALLLWRKLRKRVAGRAWKARVREGRAVEDRAAELDGGPAPVVHVYSLCRNEAAMIPWFVAHYSAFAERIVVYDNGSTDGSPDLLSSYPNVTVRSFDTGGLFDEVAMTELRNRMWRESRGLADFVVVCDMDEFLFHPRIRGLLAAMKEAGKTILQPVGAQMVSETFPAWRPGLRLTDLLRNGVLSVPGTRGWNRSKQVLFAPDRVDMRFGYGSHRCRPRGTVDRHCSVRARLLHYDLVGRDRLFDKMRENRGRTDPRTSMRGLGWHYAMPEQMRLEQFERLLRRARPVVRG